MKNDFLLEVGCEELPAHDTSTALTLLKEKTCPVLKNCGLSSQKISIFTTPRRLVVYLENVKGENLEKSLKIFVARIINSIKFEKMARWEVSGVSFSRPIRWLVILLNKKILKVEFAKVVSNNITFGPRHLFSPKFKINSIKDYFLKMKKWGIILDFTKRREKIVKNAEKLAKKVNGEFLKQEDLVEEVTNLVEVPFPILGKFEKNFLKLPKEVLITVMKKHQRYFPIVKNNKLLSFFITVLNGKFKDVNLVRKGNEKVLRARFNDGVFFYKKDTKHKLSYFTHFLSQVIFHEKIGTVYEKTKRIEILSLILSKRTKNCNKKILSRSAKLIKADLTTSLVKELPELQGIIGKYYALKAGEGREVAEAILEHYLPRFTNDKLPLNIYGQLLSIADRIDTLASCFAINLIPTGSSDPYALRRTSLGLVEILSNFNLDLTLDFLISKAKNLLPVSLSPKKEKELKNFIKMRFLYLQENKGIKKDLVKSALSNKKTFYETEKIIELLQKIRKKQSFQNFLSASKRIKNIIKDKPLKKVNSSYFKKIEEKKLYKKIKEQKKKIEKDYKKQDYQNILKTLLTFTPFINSFFEKILVMEKDKKLRENRIALLQEVWNLFSIIFNPSQIS